LAQVQEAIAIAAPRQRVFALVRDQAQRHRFLPDGWRVVELLTDQHDRPGATMSVEAAIGPAPLPQVLQVQAVWSESPGGEGQSQLVESPPAADNYITTWTVRDHEEGSLVVLHTDFSYGGMVGEFFVRRRLRRAYRQMLSRLKAAAEGQE
jgi:ribosome-associated toxin RatA of RatAB toxin-antitoxin module